MLLVGKNQLCCCAQMKGCIFVNFYERYKQLCNEVGKTPTGVGKELGIDRATVSYWKSGSVPKHEKITKIANYFNVSVDYLSGRSENRQYGINGDSIAKVALFGGDTNVTEEMWEEVKQYAEFIKQKQKKE